MPSLPRTPRGERVVRVNAAAPHRSGRKSPHRGKARRWHDDLWLVVLALDHLGPDLDLLDVIAHVVALGGPLVPLQATFPQLSRESIPHTPIGGDGPCLAARKPFPVG